MKFFTCFALAVSGMCLAAGGFHFSDVTPEKGMAVAGAFLFFAALSHFLDSAQA